MFRSDLSGKSYPDNQKIHFTAIRTGILDLIQRDHPGTIEYIARGELDEYRQRYIEESLRAELETGSVIEQEVIDKIRNHELISDNLEDDWDKQYTFGQRVADRVASFGGSWTFIICFCSFIVLWIVVNLVALFSRNFDPYPFILLNLILSCLAALQAPVIMMSQNRSEQKDRQRAKEDYKINLKSEIEIQTLHEKIDHLIINQQTRLFETQNIQVEMLREITGLLNELKRTHGSVPSGPHTPHAAPHTPSAAAPAAPTVPPAADEPQGII